MGALLEFAVQMHTICCCVCGMEFAVPDGWYRARLRGDGGNRGFHCPNGHAQHFVGKTAEERLREELQRAEAKAAQERTLREAAERSATAQRAQTTKAKNENKRLRTRVANGVCPCCNRTFGNLARHMSAKHPDFQHKEDGPHVLQQPGTQTAGGLQHNAVHSPGRAIRPRRKA